MQEQAHGVLILYQLRVLKLFYQLNQRCLGRAAYKRFMLDIIDDLSINMLEALNTDTRNIPSGIALRTRRALRADLCAIFLCEDMLFFPYDHEDLALPALRIITSSEYLIPVPL